MRFKRPDKDGEAVSDCGRYVLRRDWNCYRLFDDRRPKDKKLVGEFSRRKDAVAKAEELRQQKINELVAGMVTA